MVAIPAGSVSLCPRHGCWHSDTVLCPCHVRVMSLSLVSATDTLQPDRHLLSAVYTSTHTQVYICVSVYTLVYCHCLCTSHHTTCVTWAEYSLCPTRPCPYVWAPNSCGPGNLCVTWTSTLRPLHQLSVCLLRGLWNQHNTIHLLRNKRRPQNTHKWLLTRDYWLGTTD